MILWLTLILLISPGYLSSQRSGGQNVNKVETAVRFTSPPFRNYCGMPGNPISASKSWKSNAKCWNLNCISEKWRKEGEIITNWKYQEKNWMGFTNTKLCDAPSKWWKIYVPAVKYRMLTLSWMAIWTILSKLTWWKINLYLFLKPCAWSSIWQLSFVIRFFPGL